MDGSKTVELVWNGEKIGTIIFKKGGGGGKKRRSKKKLSKLKNDEMSFKDDL